MALFADGSLRSSEAGDGDTERAAGDVVQADVMAELDGGGIAAVLAADTELDVRTGGAAHFGGHLHELADALLVEVGERIGLVDLVVVVGVEELAGIVAAEAERHLGQVVRAEGEELGLGGDLVRGQSGARDLDHGADGILHLDTGLFDQAVGRGGDDVLDELQLLDLADQRDHDLRLDAVPGELLVDLDGGVDDGGGLHLGDLRIGDSQTAAAVAHHRVELMQRGDDVLELGDADVQLFGDLGDVLFLRRQELVQRGIQEADGHRTALELAVHGLEVALLIRQDLGQSFLAGLDRLGDDHLAHGLDTGGLEEHVLRAAQADAFGAELHSLRGVAGVIGVRADAQNAEAVGPLHEAVKVAADGGLDGLDGAAVDVAGGAVDGDPVALVVILAGEGEVLLFLVHGDLTAAGDAAGAHAARDDGSVGRHAAADGQDALCGSHALDVLGAGLKTDEDDLFAVGGPGLCVLGGEDNTAAGSARRGGQALADDLGGLQRGGVELRVQQGIELLRLHAHDGLFAGDHALVDEVAGDLQRGGSGALAVTGLQHVELAVLDGELHILHVAVVVLEAVGNVGELVVDSGHLLMQLGDLARRADTGDDILALGVDEVFAEQRLLTGGRIAREGDAGAGLVVQIAEDHRLHVDGGAPGVGDVVHAAIDVGAGVIPGAEDGLDGLHELDRRIGREVLALFFLIVSLEQVNELLHVVGVEVDVVLDALGGLDFVDDDLECLLGQLHDDVGEHLDKAAIGIVNKAGKRRRGVTGDETGGDLVVQAEVQDGVHHAGHGGAGAGTDGDEQRVLGVAELLAVDLLDAGESLVDLRLDLVVDVAVVLIILRAGFRGDGEALRDRHAEIRHLCQVCALAAEQLTHGAVTLGEQVNIFVHTVDKPLSCLGNGHSQPFRIVFLVLFIRILKQYNTIRRVFQ